MFAGIPMIPIKSMRIIPKGSEAILLGSRKSYLIVSELPLNWRQVWCVWGFTSFFICWMIGELSLFTYFELNKRWQAYLLLPCSLAPFAVPVWLRKRAKGKIVAVRQKTGAEDNTEFITVQTLLRKGAPRDRLKVIGALLAGLTLAALIIFVLRHLGTYAAK
jgi:hypothetical protein